MKKKCAKFQKWLETKGIPISFICYDLIWLILIITHVESILFYKPYFKYLTRYANLRKPVRSEYNVYSENKMSSQMKATRPYYLTLSNGFVLESEKTFYLSSFSRNLISVSRFIPFWIFH